jgi:hypothetical protein
LFIYQPNTIAIAIAFPVDALVLISVIRLVPPTLTVVAVTPPTVNEVAVTTPTLRLDGGEILVENPARPDALDILCYFLVIYQELIPVLITLNFVVVPNAGVASNLTLFPTIPLLNVAKLSSVRIVPYSVK